MPSNQPANRGGLSSRETLEVGFRMLSLGEVVLLGTKIHRMPPKNPLLVQFSELQHSKHVQDLWAEETSIKATANHFVTGIGSCTVPACGMKDIMRFGVHGVNFPFPTQCPKSSLSLNA